MNHDVETNTLIGKRGSTKALIKWNGCSIAEINNAKVDPLSPCPVGAKLENQCST
tara:strand:- start:1917 stop:2081 length:165 start_codon:yes stop_codon:yes gene_type:complete